MRWTLGSLGNQTIRDQLTVHVINDGKPGEAEGLCKLYGAKYYWTGREGTLTWRTPSVVLNYAVKNLVTSDSFLIIGGDMHLIGDDCIGLLIADRGPKKLCIPIGKDDKGPYLEWLQKENTHNAKLWQQQVHLNTKLPFCMCLQRDEFIEIGGYDLDFTEGFAYDDTDFIERMVDNGCQYVQTEARVIHLYHSRKSRPNCSSDLTRNRALYTQRKGIIHRNVGREWGQDLK